MSHTVWAQWKPITCVGISKFGFTSSNFTSFVKAFLGFLEMPIVDSFVVDDSDWPPDLARPAFLFGSRNNKSEGRSDWKNSCGGINNGTFSLEKYFVKRSSAVWSSRESEMIISSKLLTFQGSLIRTDVRVLRSKTPNLVMSGNPWPCGSKWSNIDLTFPSDVSIIGNCWQSTG